MYIADIVPLAYIPRPQAQVFSYFLPRELPKGALVEVPVGRRIVKGVVLATRPIRGSKLEIRKSDFELKSIKSIHSHTPVYQTEQLELLSWLAEAYWAPLGKVFALAPLCNGIIEEPNRSAEQSKSPPIYMQGSEIERARAYVEHIKSVLEKQQKIFVLCPDIYTLTFLAESLAKALPDTLIITHRSGATKKAVQKTIQALQNPESPCVLLATRLALFYPFTSLGLVIIEGVGNTAYQAWGRTPRYPAVDVAKKLAELHGAQLIYGDYMSTVEFWKGVKENKVNFSTSSKNIISNASCEIIDLRYEKRWSSRHQLSAPIKEEIRRAIRGEHPFQPSVDPASRKQILIFVNRKGIATALVCQSCGYVPKCPNCEAALVLHETSYKPRRKVGIPTSLDQNHEASGLQATSYKLLRCHHCGKAQNQPRQCQKCQSYRFFPVGTGTAQVEKDVQQLLPEARILRIDSDVVKTPRELERRMKVFRDKEADILIGTQLVAKEALLPNVALTVILGAEQFLVFPQYTAAEEAFRLFELLRRRTTEKTLIQTMDADTPFLKSFMQHDVAGFLDRELEQRRAFGYPPFGELIKLSFAHRLRFRAENEAKKLAGELSSVLKTENYKSRLQSRIPTSLCKDSEASGLKTSLLGPSPAFIAKERGKWKFVILLKLPLLPVDSPSPARGEVWRDGSGEWDKIANRNSFLRLVPPGWQVEVNPKEIL